MSYKCIAALSVILLSASSLQAEAPQYRSGDISVIRASADEPLREEFSLAAAKDYLTKGSRVWMEKNKCVSCHTDGVYMQLAPSLGDMFGEHVKTTRDLFAKKVAKLKESPTSSLTSGIKPTEIAYIAQGLASWDKHNGGKLSAETKDALDLMLAVQSADGSFSNAVCWPPLESSNYHSATVAAMALRAAPEYLKQLDDKQQAKVELLKNYLRDTKPPHDYARVLLLWASTKWEGLLDDSRQKNIVEMILSRQNDDGGWAMRDFAKPEQWGDGTRADKLKAEPRYKNPPSDGHQTGLAVMVLREAGIKADRKEIKAAVKWLKSNQRESGRWWTRSLSTDGSHYITYSGTFYPLIALQKCGELD